MDTTMNPRPMVPWTHDPTVRILVVPSPPSLNHSPDSACVGAQRITFVGRFLA